MLPYNLSSAHYEVYYLGCRGGVATWWVVLCAPIIQLEAIANVQV
jgi:hypothetical protein